MSNKLTEVKPPKKTSNVLDLDSVRIIHARKQRDFINKQWQESLKSNYQLEENSSNKHIFQFIDLLGG